MSLIETALLGLAAAGPTIIICHAISVWCNDKNWTGEKE